jgi:predicted PurR-regulated permease PerM
MDSEPAPGRAQQPDMIRSILVITVIGMLIAFSIWILKPFLPALIWATMIAVATWPMMRAAEARLWRKRWLAVVVMTFAMSMVFLIPLALALGTIVSHVGDITEWAKSFDPQSLNTPPGWVAKIPLVGEKIAATWIEWAAEGDLGGKIAPYTGALVGWFVGQIGTFGGVLVQILLTIVVTALLYAKGEIAAGGVVKCARKIGGDRGEAVVVLASKAIRGVAMGVVITAIVQAVLGGIGLAIAGVPYAAVFTAAMFMLAVAQIGVGPVLVCAVIWLFWRGDTGWGIALGVWTVLVTVSDNVLRPVLIKKGVDLPMILILVGVIGGLIAFGLVGLFVGPMVLAVTYTLVSAWVNAPPADECEAGVLRDA